MSQYIYIMVLAAMVAGCSKTNQSGSNFVAKTVAAVATPNQDFLGTFNSVAYENKIFSLTWDPSISSTGRASITYNIYSGNYETKLKSTTSTQAVVSVTGLKGDSTYTLAVSANDGVTEAKPKATRVVKLSKVIDCTNTVLSATASNSNAIDLSWSSCPGATEYRIYHPSGSQTGTLVYYATVQASSKTSTYYFTDSGLSAGHSYTYVIRPYDTSGDDVMGATDSNPVTVSTFVDQRPTCAGLTSLAAPSGNDGVTQLKFSWAMGSPTVSTRTVHYHVYLANSSSGLDQTTPVASSNSVTNSAEGNNIPTTGTTTTVVSGLSPNTTYYGLIRCYEIVDGSINSDGNSIILSATTNTADESSGASISSISPNFGLPAGGTTVTITGSNFIPGSTIKFGSVAAASTTFVSSTQFTVVTPAGSGVVPVNYTSPSGKSASLASAFSFTANAAPTIASVDVSQVANVGGTTVNITGTNFTAGAMVSLAGSTVTPASVTATNIQFTTPAASAGIYDLVVQNTDLQTATLSQGITYLASPTIASVSPAVVSAQGGSNFVVNGTNFSQPMTVMLGGIACTVFSMTATEIDCVAGANGAVTTTLQVDVVVSNIASQSATLTNGVLYSAQSAPLIASLLPGAGPLSGGNRITIIGSNFVSGATVKIGTQTCSSVTFNSSSSLTCTAPSSASVVSKAVQVQTS